MAVNLPAPNPALLHPIAGVELGVAMAGVKKPGRKDLLVMRLAPGSAVAGVFTRNRFCAAPVILAKKHLKNDIQALVINTGNANAGTGEDGLKRAAQVCEALASHLGCDAEEVLPFSTGVIMEPLPAERIVAALPKALLAKTDWLSAAEAIMTTDTVPKAFSKKLKLSKGQAHVTGIAKGAGMIRPDMATMLGFVATDAAVPRKVLQDMLERVADRSFNCISVDGDTSTNDSFMLIATGHGPAIASKRDALKIEAAITDVARDLAQAIVRDGEGATKFVTRARRARKKHRGMPPGGVCHRALAAGEDRLLRLRPEPRPHPGRHRLFRRRGENREGGPLPRRGTGRQRRWAPSRLPRRARRRGDAQAGVHRARGAEPRQGGRYRLDLRFLL